MLKSFTYYTNNIFYNICKITGEKISTNFSFQILQMLFWGISVFCGRRMLNEFISQRDKKTLE